MRILILSLSRCGSSAVFYYTLNQIPACKTHYFEPDASSLLTTNLPSNTVAKVILDELDHQLVPELVNVFDETVLILRDPRDRMVSSLLFAMHGVEDSLFQFRLNELSRKQRAPANYAFLDLVENLFSGWNRSRVIELLRNNHQTLKLVEEAEGTINLVKYEDFISSGFKLHSLDTAVKPVSSLKIPGMHSYGKRKVTPGDWKNWFTDTDIGFLEPHLNAYLKEFGFSESWELNNPPLILPEHSTDYVRSIHRIDALNKLKGIQWNQS